MSKYRTATDEDYREIEAKLAGLTEHLLESSAIFAGAEETGHEEGDGFGVAEVGKEFDLGGGWELEITIRKDLEHDGK